MSSHHRKHLANYLASKKSGQQSSKSASSSNGRSPGKYSVLPDISTLSVKAKKFSAMNTRSAHSQTQPRVLTRKSGKDGILDLPDELVLTIFSYLSAMDLISASQVCSRWNPVANDNVLWASVYETYGDKGEAKKGKDDTTNYKRQCLKSCVQMRNRQCQRLIKKINPFTGLPRDTEKALRAAGVTFQLSLVDRSDKERVLESRDMFVHQMSFTVRWYDLKMPALTSLKLLNFYSVNPLFFTAEGKVVSNGPTSKSLLVHVDLAWTKWLQSNKPAGSDGMVNIYNLPEGLAIATWKEDGGLAFVCLGLHFNLLLQRCLQGSSVSPFDVNRHTLITDDIDSAYG
ncbi:F-box only protein 15-like [Dreissena polymorpha]|uniref:F-box only protein 15-like n=1 Tax=Dreissena polymorpha TaxID=45954 RepID=UPI002265658D|nr:F-box only protein 15-like [Dreissena polymorpha]